MENVLWNIVQFNPNVGPLRLVSKSWAENLDENGRLILESFQKKYKADTIHESMKIAVSRGDVDMVRKILTIGFYLPIGWDQLAPLVSSREMAETLAPNLSIAVQVPMWKRLGKSPQEMIQFLSIRIDDPRAPEKLYYQLVQGNCPHELTDLQTSVSESEHERMKNIIQKMIDTYGVGKIPVPGRNCIGMYMSRGVSSYRNRRPVNNYSWIYEAPFEEEPKCPTLTSNDIVEMTLNYKNKELYDLIKDPVCIHAEDADAILRFVLPSAGIENRIRGAALGAALIRGWDYLLDRHLNMDNILLAMANVLGKHGIYKVSPKSWRFLTNASKVLTSTPIGASTSGRSNVQSSRVDFHPSWFRYYGGLGPKPLGLSSDFWKKLLANAVAVSNIPLIRNIAKIHKNDIDMGMELNIMALARKNGTYSDELMRAIQGK